MITLRPFDQSAVLHVAKHMRKMDAREIYNTHFEEQPEFIAAMCGQVPGFTWVAFDGDEPVAVIGARPMWPKVWGVFGFGTEGWPRAALTVTRHALKFMFPAVYNTGAQRAMCFSHAEHHDAHRWLEALGGSREATLPAFGKDGAAYHLYSWLREAGHVPEPSFVG